MFAEALASSKVCRTSDLISYQRMFLNSESEYSSLYFDPYKKIPVQSVHIQTNMKKDKHQVEIVKIVTTEKITNQSKHHISDG